MGVGKILNVDFDGSRKEFWAFVGRRTEGKKRVILEFLREYKG